MTSGPACTQQRATKQSVGLTQIRKVHVLMQLRGRKRVRLIAEAQLPYIYAYPHNTGHLLARRYHAGRDLIIQLYANCT